jgi:uncharacterized membrane protein YeaQ/YmgE (transglycosylase-associated protein family)
LGLSNPLVVALVILWCSLGAVVGWCSGILVHFLRPRQGTKRVLDVLLGAGGALGGAFCSGWLNETRPAVQVGPFWIGRLGTLVAEHQTVFAVMSATFLVLAIDLVAVPLLRRARAER